MIVIVSLVYRAMFGEGIKELGKERGRKGPKDGTKQKNKKTGLL